MKNNLIKTTTLFTIFLLATFLSAVYYLQLSVSEDKIVAAKSIESFLLIPNLLKDERLTRMGTVKNYYYDSKDGPKPTITKTKILVQGEEKDIKNDLIQYFVQNGFKENGKKELWKNGKTILIDFKKTNKDLWLVDISLWEY